MPTVAPTATPTVAPADTARRFVQSILAAGAPCRDSYATMAGAVSDATTSALPGALMGFGDLLNGVRRDCARALRAVEAMPIPATLRPYAPVSVFDTLATTAARTAVDSVASLTRIMQSPPRSPSPDNDTALANALDSQIGFDNVAGAFASAQTLAPRVVRYVSAPPSAAAGWRFQTLPLTATVTGIACPTATTCYTVGGAGMIATTANGGATWRSQTSPAARGVALVALACPTTVTCYAAGITPGMAAGRHGLILATRDGGAAWRRVAAGLPTDLMALACPSATTCYALTATPTILVSRDSGRTWHAHNPLLGTGLRRLNAAGTLGVSLMALACPAATTCIAVGDNSTGLGLPALILRSRDGGATWRARPNPRGGDESFGSLFGLACPTILRCVAVGDSGLILGTTDGGKSWRGEASGTGAFLSSVACGVRACTAVGDQGAIVATADGGATWRRETNLLSGTNSILGPIACPAAATCYAGADTLHGFLLATTTGGDAVAG